MEDHRVNLERETVLWHLGTEKITSNPFGNQRGYKVKSSAERLTL